MRSPNLHIFLLKRLHVTPNLAAFSILSLFIRKLPDGGGIGGIRLVEIQVMGSR